MENSKKHSQPQEEKQYKAMLGNLKYRLEIQSVRHHKS